MKKILILLFFTNLLFSEVLIDEEGFEPTSTAPHPACPSGYYEDLSTVTRLVRYNNETFENVPPLGHWYGGSSSDGLSATYAYYSYFEYYYAKNAHYRRVVVTRYCLECEEEDIEQTELPIIDDGYWEIFGYSNCIENTIDMEAWNSLPEDSKFITMSRSNCCETNKFWKLIPTLKCSDGFIDLNAYTPADCSLEIQELANTYDNVNSYFTEENNLTVCCAKWYSSDNNDTNQTDGNNGNSGADGNNDTNQTDGNNGNDGNSGTDGSGGTDGTNGSDGTNGTSGTNGSNGSNATSVGSSATINTDDIIDAISNLSDENSKGFSDLNSSLGDIKDLLSSDNNVSLGDLDSLGSILEDGIGGITSRFSTIVSYNLGVAPTFSDSSDDCNFLLNISYGTFDFELGAMLDSIRPYLNSLWSFLFIYISFLMYYRGFSIIVHFL